jgi:predicted DsbA family dithiol-disulfide isomerase
VAWQLAIASPWIRADAVEVSEYPELIRRYAVRGVPRTIVNETVHIEGALPEAQYVEAVLRAAAAPIDEGTNRER